MSPLFTSSNAVVTRHFSLVSLLVVLLFTGFTETAAAQVTVGFQGGEPGDTWSFTSPGASALAISEAHQPANYITGTASIVCGGNTGGGNCFDTGSGNGPAVARTFTFSALDISSSNFSTRTLTFNWGNRFPACVGTGWDSGENLVFRAYHDNIGQPPVTIVTGNNNATFDIHNNQYTWSIPPCVNSFYFTISVTTNRADELLFLDDVRMTAPQLNGTLGQPSAITGPVSVCAGSTVTYGVTAESGITYTWSGLPAGASFTTPNGTTAANTIGVNWGTAAQGTYTLTVTPSNSCGGAGTPQTINVTVVPPSAPVTISGPTSMCAGETITLTSSYTTGNSWSTTPAQTTQSISVTAAGTYTVSVTTPCGVITASHTVTITPAPVIQSVTPTAVSCFGANNGSITVTSAETGLQYSLDGTTWQASNVFSNLAPGTYTVHVQSTTGCQATAAPVTVTQPAALTATASNTGPYCAGAPIVLNGSTSATGTPAYSWTGPNSYTSNVQNPTNATQAGTYTLTVTAGGCTSNAASTTVVVRPVVTAAASNGGPYCAGAPIQLTGSTTTTGTMTSYGWTGPNSYVSAVQNPSNATQGGAYTLTVTVDGCQSTPVSTVVVVNALPVAQASYNAPFCTGNPLQLNGTTTATGATYMWSGPNGYTSTAQNPSDATQAGMYTLVVTSNGCQSLQATVNVVSEVPAVLVSNTGPYCEGTPVQLYGSTNTPGAITYSWTGPNGYTSAVQNPSDATESGVYSLTVNVNNCLSQASTVVTIHPVPTAAFSSSPACFRDSTVFASSASVPGPEVITTYSWDFGDGNTSAVQHPRHLYAQSGTFPVELEVRTAANCSAVIVQNVTVAPIPEADFYYSPNTISLLDPQVQFNNASTGATDYMWHFGFNDDMSTEESPEYTYPEWQGNYTVELIAYNADGCRDTIRKVVTVKEELIYYIPNAFTPDGDEFNQYFTPVFASGFDPANYTLMLYNRWGEVVFESHDATIGWDGTYKGELAQEGTYTWNIVVKQRQTDAFENLVGQVTLLK